MPTNSLHPKRHMNGPVAKGFRPEYKEYLTKRIGVKTNMNNLALSLLLFYIAAFCIRKKISQTFFDTTKFSNRTEIPERNFVQIISNAHNSDPERSL